MAVSVTPIVLASIIFALLMAPALNLIGFRWSWAWLCAVILSAGLGASAAVSAGIF